MATGAQGAGRKKAITRSPVERRRVRFGSILVACKPPFGLFTAFQLNTAFQLKPCSRTLRRHCDKASAVSYPYQHQLRRLAPRPSRVEERLTACRVRRPDRQRAERVRMDPSRGAPDQFGDGRNIRLQYLVAVGHLKPLLLRLLHECSPVAFPDNAGINRGAARKDSDRPETPSDALTFESRIAAQRGTTEWTVRHRKNPTHLETVEFEGVFVATLSGGEGVRTHEPDFNVGSIG